MARSTGANVCFAEDLQAHPTVPAMELWTKLLENARHKQQLQPGLEIAVKLTADGKEGISLEVCDSGEAINREKARLPHPRKVFRK